MKFLKYKSCYLLLISMLSVGCTGVNLSEWQFPYYYPVQQGNYITQQQLSSLKLGMQKTQVINILGTPVTQFMFSESQWQYMYQYYNHDELKASYIVNLRFNDSNLVAIESVGELFDR